MSVRSFHSVFMASAVAGAALGCYLVSLRVASERAALEDVESAIVQTQSDIRLLQTEVGTRARLTQLERWNVRALALSAPTAEQILGDKFQLAKLVRPEDKPAMEAPVVLASAPAPQPAQPLANEGPEVAAAGQLLHEASFEVPERTVTPIKAETTQAEPKQVEKKPASVAVKKAGDKSAKPATVAMTRPVRAAKVDPLAPLPVERHPAAKGSRTTQ
ncbi:MAG TPA: hypothetical protein VFS69_03300 [Sphingomicrobium sp.]|nr:hypothetical protein [Sphingomicrobium sp.]